MSKYRIIKCNQKCGQHYYFLQKQCKFLPFIKFWFTKTYSNDWEFWPDDPQRFYNIEDAKAQIAVDKASDNCKIESVEIIKVE